MVDVFFCILDFPTFSRGGPPDPPYKGNASIKPSKSFFNNNSSQKGKNKLESPPPLKQYIRTLSLDYTEIEKRRRALGQDLFCVICNWAVWNFDLCYSRRKSLWFPSSWALLIFLLCLWWPNFLCCVITRNGESSRDLLLSVTNRKALVPVGNSPHELPLKHLLHYYQSLSHNSTRSWVLVGEKG